MAGSNSSSLLLVLELKMRARAKDSLTLVYCQLLLYFICDGDDETIEISLLGLLMLKER